VHFSMDPVLCTIIFCKWFFVNRLVLEWFFMWAYDRKMFKLIYKSSHGNTWSRRKVLHRE
jgi:hypothetical protein